ncbi:glycosyltransferase family 2 protein [Leeuwenhoekiella marinoflava]|uniref:Glycosyltransferase involved in cell wall biosynthesis n=2 Tax=Leeuwenhoekiella marinoflava TaxID=988 RepID=A0A4Q0PJ91_9FLAO|nr:glycosyltransferase family 2 protein [Leeuwenhoekiella marinoflava]RXG26915.1 glycosyltransferase involved in cell wall biosynthesis [Leeuwenhoekiella marinoflava]SHF41047.1 Glycosyltransferase involved in cell wall bisynthesis [Leeuwenhoekiella marinoflava DSM 3653]
MHEQPLVSIIIPTYNRAHLIGETLDSVLAQTYTNWECIVVDDGSTDETDKVLAGYVEKDSRFQYHHRPNDRPNDRPKGANACRNYGFELSNGEYIQWFDSDDLMVNTKLEKQLNLLNKSEFDFCVCNALRFDSKKHKELDIPEFELKSANNFSSYLRLEIIWLTSSPLWNRNLLKKFYSLFNEELQAAQEWEFYCRILNRFGNYAVVNEPLIYLRQHNGSISSSYNQEDRDWNYCLARILVYSNNEIFLNNQDREYLRNYLIDNFKYFTYTLQLDKSKLIFQKFILKDSGFSIQKKLLSFVAFISYKIFRRGYILLNKI